MEAPAAVLFDHILRRTLDERLVSELRFCGFQVRFQFRDFLVQTFPFGCAIRFSGNQEHFAEFSRRNQ